MNSLFKIIIASLFLTLCIKSIHAQKTPLDNYIDSALQNNIALQQKNISVEKAMYALKTAKSLFQPVIAFQGSYQSGEGGRSIDFPVGDLLNPVYSTLNKLTASNKFPQIENVTTNFFPRNFYDARLNALMPLYNKDLKYNREIQEQQLQLQQTDMNAYKRELVKSIKVAYFNYLASLKATIIIQNAIQLAIEGKRANEKLMANGKGLPAYILRSETEISMLNAQLNESKKQSESAKMFFNFLLNRDLEIEIDTNYNEESGLLTYSEINSTAGNISQREELKLLEGVVELNKTVLKMNQHFWYPKLNGYFNLGSQSQSWEFNNKSAYYLGGLQLDLPLFAGKRNQYKIKQTQLDIALSENNLKQTTQQLNLIEKIAKNNLQTAFQNYTVSLKQLETAETYQRLIDRGYREGVNTYLETVDARSQFMNASQLKNINLFKVLIAAAEYEREIASFNIQSK
jgi:outer membrane protein TolC